MSNMTVDIAELRTALDMLASINRMKLSDIDWIRADGTKIEIPQQVIDDWRFWGLSNISFAELMLPETANIEWKNL